MITYRAVARRSGDGWDVTVPDVPEATARVDLLDDARAAAAHAVAKALGVEADDVDIDVQSSVDVDVDAHVVDLAAAEHHPDTAAATVRMAQQRLAHRLAGMGLSARDSAYMMNLSHHRVRHLVESPAEPEVPGADRGTGAQAENAE